MENGLTIREENQLALVAERGIQDLIKPLTKEIFLLDSYVAGTTTLKNEAIICEIKEGEKLILQRENNRFDKNAIAVLTSKQMLIGYVPEKENTVFSRLMDAGKLLVAKARKTEQKGLFKQINIEIYMVDF
jgi:hypothetical protein